MNEAGTLLCFGMGFAGATLGRLLKAEGWRVIGTARLKKDCAALKRQGFEAVLFNGREPGDGVRDALRQATHLLSSIPPDENGDPLLRHHKRHIIRDARLRWLGFLSTVGVYGEHHGGWVDEMTKPEPIASRSRFRLDAERQWRAAGFDASQPPHIFRLPGIYGPGRNQLVSLKRGKARRLVKKGQVFNRVHVADVASAVRASILNPEAGYLFNVVDDEPAPPQDVVACAAGLLGVKPPPEVDFDAADLSPMARSFYGECKRVRNDQMKQKLGVKLKYPTYREGLRALCEEMREAAE